MNLLSEITLRWYDDSSLIVEDRRELVELFINSLGITRETAADIFEVLLIAKSKDMSLTTNQIKEAVIELRTARGKDVDRNLTMRNIQIWIKFFRELGFLEKVGRRYLFKGNQNPSKVFRENVKPQIVDNSCEFLARVLEKLEENYRIKKK